MNNSVFITLLANDLKHLNLCLHNVVFKLYLTAELVEKGILIHNKKTITNQREEMESIKCVLVGDRVGKTSMLIKYTTQVFPVETLPTVYDKFTTNLSVDGKPVTLHLCDSSGSECYDRLRPMMYPRTDVYIICFSLEEKSQSFENVQKKWWPEVMHHLPTSTTPVILVGTKQDIRDAQLTPEKIEESQVKGRELAKDINAVKYMECSALENIGLAEVFQACVRVVRHPPRLRSKQNPEVLLPNYLRRFYSCCRLI